MPKKRNRSVFGEQSGSKGAYENVISNEIHSTSPCNSQSRIIGEVFI